MAVSSEQDHARLSGLHADSMAWKKPSSASSASSRHAAQGLEERKQILYLLGPVGGGKSSLAERLKSLMEVHPIYVLKAGDELSPVFESPLSLFDPESLGPMIEEKYGIPRRRLHGPMSPWCYKPAGSIARRHFTIPGRQNPALALAADRGRENRAWRREQSGTSPRWSARSTFASWRPSPRTTLMPIALFRRLDRSNQGVLEFVEMFKASNQDAATRC